MTQLVVAVDHQQAADHARQTGLTGRWQAVTPDNYQLVERLAVPRADVHWADTTWQFTPDLLDAVSGCIRRGNE
jgi:hypothetical protein